MRYQFFRTAVAGLVFITLGACNKAADAPGSNTPGADASKTASGPSLPDGRNATALVEALDSATMIRMEQRTGDWSEGDASSKWRAMASGGKIRLIDETMTAGESSTRRITHYFTDTGNLVAYYEFRIQTVMSGSKSPEKQFVLFKIEFLGDSITKIEKSVNGTAQPVQPFEIENARKHSTTLLSAAQAAPVSSPAKP